MRAALFAFFLLATPALAQVEYWYAESDLDGNGFFETFELLDTGEGSVDLIIGTSTGTISALRIAWNGWMEGQIPALQLARNGSVQLVSGNQSVGRDRWLLTLTIAYRDQAYRVAGLTYEWYDTLDPNNTGTCDVNLLTGQGDLLIGDGPVRRVTAPFRAPLVTEWRDDFPLPPAFCQ
jgi:hypothetical protein